MGQCLSILQLEYKKGLIKVIKADKLYATTLKSKIFDGFREVTEESREFRDK